MTTGNLESYLNAQLVLQAKALKVLASRCDAMCLTTGIQLGEAVPSLYELSSQFASLSAMLVDEDGAKPVRSLQIVARDLMTTGTALSEEIDAVTNVIHLNSVLTRRISDLADNVRFLSSVVSNVKIEIATINEGELRLEGFADNLKQLASKSEATVKAFQATHQNLIKQLRRTSVAQAAFVSSHGVTFAVASRKISASLGSVANRRKTVSAIAAEIGAITQKIGTEIAQCVVGLQVGDSTRQCLEHAGDGLTTAAEISADIDSHGVFVDEPIDEEPAERYRIVARICQLQTTQTVETTIVFSTDVGTTAHLIGQITNDALALLEKSRGLVSAPAVGSQSFLADLEAKLAFASDLIDECGKSRKLVDDTAEQVIASVLDLQRLAQNVAAMATDMMIIGTNAVVTSYRLGTKGIPLSVIAQHLRNHAVHVTDAVKLVSPALAEVLEAAKQFTSAREGQDAGSMEGLASRITDALTAFQNGDNAVAEVHARLETVVSTVDGVLRRAGDALHDIDEIETALRTVAQAVDDLIAARDIEENDRALPPALDRLLRKRYTMGAERIIHDNLFGKAAAAASPPPAEAPDAALWL